MADYRNPQWLLPNCKNLKLPEAGATTGSGLTEDRHSLYSMDFNSSSSTEIKTGVINLNGDFTISLWSKWDNSVTYHYLWDFRDQSSSNPALYLYNNTLQLYISGAVFASSTITQDGNTWYNIILVRSGNTYTAYKDGASLASGTDSTVFVNSELTIGNRSTSVGTTGMDGSIDEVAIWNSDQTSNISNIYNGGSPGNLMALSNKPYAYYPLGEQARDNTEWQFPNQVLQSQVFDFDGSTDFISSTNSGISGLNNATVSVWVKPTGSTSGQYKAIVNQWELSNSSWWLGLNGTGSTYRIHWNQSGASGVDSGLIIPNDEWSHIAIVKNTTTLKMFHNGSEVNSFNISAATGSGATILNIGSQYTSSTPVNFFKGKMSNIAIWNSDQSANITNIYNYGTPQSSYTVTPTAWYKLNATNTYAGLNPNWHSALSFDGVSGNKIDVGTIASLNSVTKFTISFWSNFDSGQSNDGIIFTNRVDNNNRIVIYRYSSSIYFHINDGSSKHGYATAPSTGVWTHIAMVYNGSGSANTDKLKVYYNGTLQSLTYNTDIPSTTGTYSTSYLGARGDGSNEYKGDLSNFSIFNQSISAEDVKYLYNGGTPQTNISFEPVNWWKLDNITTGIQDSGSASNNGTNSGATEVTDSVAVNQWNFYNVPQSQTPNWSSALNFVSADSDYINLSNNSSLYPGTGDVSYSAWIKPSSTTGFKAIFGVQSLSTASKGVNIQVYNGEIWVFVGVGVSGQWGVNTGGSTGGGGFITSGANLTLNNWHHIAFTFDRDGNGIIYINGVANRTAAVNPNDYSSVDITSTADVFLGRGDGYFDGEISNAAIFNTVLSSAAISTIYNIGQPETSISSSPVSWWKLDNTTTGIQDSVGSNNGTNNGATEIQTNVWTPRLNAESTTLPSTALVSSDLQFESPYSNFSLNFDGTGNYINCTDSNMFSFGNGTTDSAFSLSTWINMSTVADFVPIAKDSSGAREWTIRMVSGQIHFYVIDNSVANGYLGRKNSFTPATDTWFNLTCTYDGSANASGIRIYLDGVRVDDADYVGTGTYVAMENTSAIVSIGMQQNGTVSQPGKIDETAIFNKALTQTEVSQVYNNGFAADLTSLSPVSWWRLGEDAYFVGNDITIPNQIANAPNGTGAGTQTSMLVADAPGSYASGAGSNLAVEDRKGDAPESSANSLSFNMIPTNRIHTVPNHTKYQVDNVYSMAFDGNNDYIDAGNPTELQLTGALTFSGWIKTSSATYQLMISKDDVTNRCYNFGLLNNGEVYGQVFNSGTATTVQTTTTWKDGNWHHIAFVYIPSTSIEIFVDGNSEILSTSSIPASIDNDPADFNIGRRSDGARYFNGNIDEVAVFDYALSNSQIYDIYTSTTTGKTANLNGNSNIKAPVAWYRMGD